ncbi:jg5712 [Pararge aegeria aegeria]|uniref:Jg5712 protein n=1 Tax=Pararge aegeria aegeria TaxID=348720 RepID=A0A8S4SG68_9NEOP|nr:jg5712 [Pararge aegeria aegeria]
MDVGVPRCWNGDPAQVNAALVAPNEVDRRHQTSRWVPLEASGPGSWNLELPKKASMSSSGLRCDDDDVDDTRSYPLRYRRCSDT